MSFDSLSEASISCSICLSNSNDDLISLPCNHHYHKKCISKNYTFEITRHDKTYYECPECRREISMDTMSNILHGNDRDSPNNFTLPTTYQESHVQPSRSQQIYAHIENSPLFVYEQASICQRNKKCIIGMLCTVFLSMVIFCITFFGR